MTDTTTVTNNSIENKEKRTTTTTTTTTTDDESILTPRPLILGISWYENDSSIRSKSNNNDNNNNNNNNNTNATIALQIARENGYDYTTTMIPNSTDNTTIRTDMINVSSQWWKTSIVGIVQQSSYDEKTNKDTNTNNSNNCILNEHIVQSSLTWSSYMNIPAIILPNLPIIDTSISSNNANDTTTKINEYCSILQTVLISTGMNSNNSSAQQQQIWIPIPLTINGLYSWNYCTMLLCRNTGSAGCTTTSPIYSLVRIPSTTILLQQFQQHLHSTTSTTSSTTGTNTTNNTITIAKYCMVLCHLFIGSGYPIGCIEFDCNDFLINKKGYPTLSKLHQILLTFLLRRIGRTVRVLVKAPPTTTTTTTTTNTTTTKSINLIYYLQYIQHIRMKRTEITTKLDTDYFSNKEYNYLDIIQQPLQPLKDHLENNTYEVFESDPIKYQQYQLAIQYYIQDYIYEKQLITKKQQQQPNSNDSNNTIIILVVGAGRGPLITAVTNAYRTVMQQQQQQQQQSSLPELQNISLSILGVEKNPSAVLYLQSMLHISKSNINHPWYNINYNIRIIQDDLRYITASKYTNGFKANLVISELLGSFGCNELSPECLQSLLINSDICHPNYTTCIPYNYTSYIAPISSIKIHQQITQQSLYPNNTYTNIIGYQQVTETPYVVRPHNASQLFIDQPCWSFTHGSSTEDDDNDNINIDDNTNTNDNKNSLERSVVLTFDGSTNPTMGTKCGCGYTDIDEQFTSLCTNDDTVDNNTNSNNMNDTSKTNDHIVPSYIITGLIGTFTTLLYKSNRTGQIVTLSTSLTNNYSSNMFSWFPLYFPLHDPILISNPQQSKLIVSIQRKCTTTKVWYEWSIQVILVNNNTSSSTSTSTTTTNTNDTTIIYISPIHNPGGRSYYVSL